MGSDRNTGGACAPRAEPIPEEERRWYEYLVADLAAAADREREIQAGHLHRHMSDVARIHGDLVGLQRDVRLERIEPSPGSDMTKEEALARAGESLEDRIARLPAMHAAIEGEIAALDREPEGLFEGW